MNQAVTTEMDIVTEVQEARTLKHRSVAKCESLRSKSERNSLKKRKKTKKLTQLFIILQYHQSFYFSISL